MPVSRLDSASDLRSLFRDYGRESTFSHHAYEWLWDYLEQYEEDTGTPLEIDVIALCCDYSEEDYDSIAQNHNIELPDTSEYQIVDPCVVGLYEDGSVMYDARYVLDTEVYEEAKREAILDYLRDNTVVLGFDDDSVLFAAF